MAVRRAIGFSIVRLRTDGSEDEWCQGGASERRPFLFPLSPYFLILYNGDVDGFSDPDKNIEQFELQSGARVADFGVGTGFYALAASRRVGSAGRVYCLDIQKDLLARLQESAARFKLDNIEVVWADLEEIGGSKLADLSLDAVIVANLLFQIEKKDDFVKEIRRVLKPGGKVLLVDWAGSFGGIGPTEANVVSKGSAVSLFEENGFKVEKEIEAGAHHWGVILKKS